ATAVFGIFGPFQRTGQNAEAIRFVVSPPDGASFDALNAHDHRFALSPDGRRIVFVATGADGKNRLWIRGLDAVGPRVLEGTEDPVAPFWSPDSRWIAFFAEQKLKKIDAYGGA